MSADRAFLGLALSFHSNATESLQLSSVHKSEKAVLNAGYLALRSPNGSSHHSHPA